ncbi:MAG: hypothetical protein LBM75_07290, partial [Myxococcales bacterium]|nr:hypothetical protein [Myxococcales bacterium]
MPQSCVRAVQRGRGLRGTPDRGCRGKDEMDLLDVMEDSINCSIIECSIDDVFTMASSFIAYMI